MNQMVHEYINDDDEFDMVEHYSPEVNNTRSISAYN